MTCRARPFTADEATALQSALKARTSALRVAVVSDAHGLLVRLEQGDRCVATAQIRRDFGPRWPASQAAEVLRKVGW